MGLWRRPKPAQEGVISVQTRKIEKKYRNILQKGIDFIEKLRYNWTVHEQKKQNRRCNYGKHQVL